MWFNRASSTLKSLKVCNMLFSVEVNPILAKKNEMKFLLENHNINLDSSL
jgi:hypothetical protein